LSNECPISPQIDPTQKQKLLDTKKEKQNTSFNGLVTWVKVVSVYDGDTATVCFFYRGDVTQCSIRLVGIDSPEIRPKRAGRTEESIKLEKQKAIESKNRLEQLVCGNQLIIAKFGKQDKYGRPLCELFLDQTKKSVNRIMVEEGHAVSYDGGHKKEFDEQ
jgi:endonuclease YncB( thermonuclease family)